MSQENWNDIQETDLSQTFTHAILAALGGGIGAAGRYFVGIAAIRLAGPNFPWGTFIVNIVGSLMIGLLVEVVARLLNQSADMRVFLVTGVLGGFTTFSSFSLDTMTMVERGDYATAALYVAASVGLGLVAAFGGLMIGRAAF
ncbi:fluoride efflux transporter CrcB [Martelella alba]|uniref:Fluoride-specific ion channel FluC n=1 Tax=Martelella alba TaxID=2590451 RepID=A0A506UIK3_9HYPH|nr:fluoride efflux transporter CrcB [Martelella alba]